MQSVWLPIAVNFLYYIDATTTDVTKSSTTASTTTITDAITNITNTTNGGGDGNNFVLPIYAVITIIISGILLAAFVLVIGIAAMKYRYSLKRIKVAASLETV